MARRKRSYALRFCYLALLLAVLGLTWLTLSSSYRYADSSLVMQAQRQAEMGKVFFSVFSLFSIGAMMLIGPVLTSTAIGSERLRRTFDVLLMTPISAWQLVGGKLFSRLLTAFTLIGLSLPVLAIVRLLGGVELDDMFGSLALAMSAAMSSAAIGLLLSCWIKRAWAVILLAYILQGLIYGLLPTLSVVVLMQMYTSNRAPGAMRCLEVLTALNPILTGILKIEGPRGMFAVSWWVTTAIQVGFAVLLTLLAANVVRRIGRRDFSGGGATTAPLPKSPVPVLPAKPEPASPAPPPLPYAPVAVRTQAKARSVSDNPVLWRELRRPLFPRRWMKVTAALSTIGLLLLSYLCFSFDHGALWQDEVQIGYAFVMHTLLLLMGVVLSATAIATEKESDTWTLLIVSPVGGQSVMWAKFIGVLRRLFWPWMVVLLHVALFTLTGVLMVWASLIVLVVTITFNLPWIAVGCYLSLRVNRVTTAVVLSLLAPVAIYGLIPMALLSIQYGLRDWERSEVAELSLYYLPYWYLGEGIDRLMGNRNYGYSFGNNIDARSFNLPFSDGRSPATFLVALTLIAGLIQTIIACLIVWWSGRRFDKLVHRAR